MIDITCWRGSWEWRSGATLTTDCSRSGRQIPEYLYKKYEKHCQEIGYNNTWYNNGLVVQFIDEEKFLSEKSALIVR